MHKLMEYICDELEQLERKADKDGKLSMAEIQYMDTLLHAKKNLLTAEAMMGEEDEEYSNAGSYSYARGGGRGRGSNARRDSMGRYSREGGGNGNRGGSYEGGSYGNSYARGGGNSNRGGGSYERGYSREGAKEELMMQLQELEQDAGDEETKRMIKKWIKQVEEQ